jgi:cell division protein ZapA
MKQLEVQIMGQSYLLGCPEGGEARLQEAVARVDAAMCKIRDAGKVKARDRIAVLAALNLAFELHAQDASPAAPQVGSTTPASAAPDSTQDAQWTSLIDRLDLALGEDGRLI